MNFDILTTAFSKYGITEMVGPANNPELLQMAKDAGFPSYVKDEIAWCSMFANWVAFKAGYEKSNSLAARSWLKVGTSVTTPELGDVVVLWRVKPDAPTGHVGFYIHHTAFKIYLLAGNQGDTVNIAGFPIERLLGYRRLAKI